MQGSMALEVFMSGEAALADGTLEGLIGWDRSGRMSDRHSVLYSMLSRCSHSRDRRLVLPVGKISGGARVFNAGLYWSTT